MVHISLLIIEFHFSEYSLTSDTRIILIGFLLYYMIKIILYIYHGKKIIVELTINIFNPTNHE